MGRMTPSLNRDLPFFLLPFLLFFLLVMERFYELLTSLCCMLSRFSRVRLFATPWTVSHQAPLSMGFSRQEYWDGLPFPSRGNLPDPGLKPGSPVLQGDSLLAKAPGKPSLAETLPQIHLGSSPKGQPTTALHHWFLFIPGDLVSVQDVISIRGSSFHWGLSREMPP